MGVHRISEMSNFFLNMLVGSKRKSLKIKDMKRINFHPAKMVENLAKLYINLSQHEEWNKAVVSDERSFSMAMMKQAEFYQNLQFRQIKSRVRNLSKLRVTWESSLR